MKNIFYPVLAFGVVSLSSCSVAKGIFKAGVWVGIFAVAIILGLILYFVGKAKK